MHRLLAICVIALAGCGQMGQVKGSGKPATEQRNLAPFSEISVDGSVEVQITIAEPQLVSVTTDDNVLPVLKTEVNGNRLTIRTTKGYGTRTPPRLTIRAARITRLEAEDSTRITIEGISGEELTVQASGSAVVEASGSARETAVRASGSSRVVLTRLLARTVDVEASGSARVEVQAVEAVSGSASGSAAVRYTGAPEVSVQTSGSATVEQAK
jgi:hypothetical protein